MKEQALKEFIAKYYSRENESCEWKEFKELKHAVSGKEMDDIISYVSALSNMNGGTLVVGIKDQKLDIIGIQDFYNYTPENLKFRVLDLCTNLPSENFYVDEYKTEDTNKTVWIIHVPKHHPRKPVIAHTKAYMRIGEQEPQSMFPDEFMRYDSFTIRESINNCIAHQDYTMGARIEVVEFENEKLVFKNAGTFIPNSINEVLASDSPESVYRNPFLVEAMRNFGMIETQGGGIKKLHILQMRRGFSLPQYNFDNMYVKLTIGGIQTNKRVPPEKIEELERTDSFDEYAEYYTKDVIEKTAIENIPQTVEMEKATLQTTLENDTTTPETTSEKIILLIRENPKITREELASACKISVDGIKWQLKKLKGKVLHTGPNKGGRWEIIGE